MGNFSNSFTLVSDFQVEYFYIFILNYTHAYHNQNK